MGRKSSPEVHLLNAITRALSQFIAETDPYILFDGLLSKLLELTDSEYGFIGEVFYSNEGSPFIKSYATTNIAWSEDTHRLYLKAKKNGMIFSNLDSLYGSVLQTGQPVLSNQPSSDPRSSGIPKGHPPLNAFIGLPFYGGGKLLGMVGIANRQGGYEQSQIDYLQPFLTTCGNLIQAYRNNLKRQQVEDELLRYQQRLSQLNEKVPLGNGYEFNSAHQTLMLENHLVILTKKELRLLQLLVDKCGQVASYQELEKGIWKDTIVSESSLRALILRLRKKLPGITIQTVTGIGYLLNPPLR
jgi:hypothetical protein